MDNRSKDVGQDRASFVLLTVVTKRPKDNTCATLSLWVARFSQAWCSDMSDMLCQVSCPTLIGTQTCKCDSIGGSSCSSYYGSVSTSAPEPRPESCIDLLIPKFYKIFVFSFFTHRDISFLHRDIRQLSGPSQCCNLGPGSLPSSDHLLPILLTTNQLPQYCRNTLAIPLQYYCNTAHHTTHLTVLPTNSQKPQYSYNALQYSPPYPSNIIAHNTFV